MIGCTVKVTSSIKTFHKDKYVMAEGDNWLAHAICTSNKLHLSFLYLVPIVP